jgi:hypothetical protein
MVRGIKTILYITLIIIFFQCDKIDFQVDCSECYQIEPDWGELYVRVTINDENEYVPLVIYRGNFENDDIEYIDTAYEKDYYLDVPLNKFYSVIAEYISGQDTICAVDGDKIRTKKNYDDCDEECYIVKGGVIDVRLKSGY